MIARLGCAIAPSIRGADSHAAVENDRELTGRRSPPSRLLNFATPSLFSVKLTAGVLYSSSVGRALRRSRPVTAGALRTR